jgi:hypothetical protein
LGSAVTKKATVREREKTVAMARANMRRERVAAAFATVVRDRHRVGATAHRPSAAAGLNSEGGRAGHEPAKSAARRTVRDRTIRANRVCAGDVLSKPPHFAQGVHHDLTVRAGLSGRLRQLA